MKKKSDKRPGYGKLLDAWVPPQDAGDPIGCVATSYTFAPAFFEEECLGRFLKLESDAREDGPVYLIEREEKLSTVSCATALVDQHYCRGPRNLRWDLLPVRMPERSVMHAKVSLLYWRNWFRIIVASANLTEDGYRRNQEIFGVLDYFDGGRAPLDCLREIAAFLDEIARRTGIDGTHASPVFERLRTFLNKIQSIPESWGSAAPIDAKETFVRPVLVGPDRPSAFATLQSQWPTQVPASDAYVTSPFFDQNEDNQPAHKIWELLRKRGQASVSYNLCADEIMGEPEKLQVNAPRGITWHPGGRQDVTVYLNRINGPNNPERVRPLHMKSLWLENERCVAYMIGSSNFTSAGLGLSGSPNYEANLVYYVGDGNRRGNKALCQSYIDGTAIDPDHVHWPPPPKPEDEAPGDEVLLPAGFAAAEYDLDEQHEARVNFRFGANLPPEWEIVIPDGDMFCNEQRWIDAGRPDTLTLPWALALPPSGFEVRWHGSAGAAWWPVNITAASVLPAPQELTNLPLEVLINILMSARPLHEILRRYLARRQTSNGNGGEYALIDPHQRVDTSGFLLQRTRRLSLALTALRERLQKPVATLENLNWRLYGPVGVRALKDAILKEAKTDMERIFLVTELALELSRADIAHAPNCLEPAVCKQALKKMVDELHRELTTAEWTASANLQQYVESAFERARA